tara:strand:+ start:675 stop:1556 length:882 start_codon:yes stop_codon:yes gene_type:complete
MTNNRKGIILAGGTGSRLYPLTIATSKQLMPVYDKPMIYYPLSVLMLSKIQDIAVISTKDYLESFKRLLGDGSKFGINLSYFVQNEPNGIAESFIITESFFKGNPVCLILGDNIFYGQGLSEKVLPASKNKNGATIFGYQVDNPSIFGVVEFNQNGKAISLEEKPDFPKSNYAITGLYFYDENVIDIARKIKPSDRGELEITDINKEYLKNNKLVVEDFGRGFAWLDMGTHDSLLEASQFIQAIEKQQGLKIACLEEIAFRNSWITKNELLKSAENLKNTNYGKYIIKILKNI